MDERFRLAVSLLTRDEQGPESMNDPSRNSKILGVMDHRLAGWLSIPVDRIKTTRHGDIERALRKEVWEACGCNGLPCGVDYFIFDCGVRFSIDDALRWLRLAYEINPTTEITESILSRFTPADAIRRVDVYVRRRLKSEAQWDECKHWWTNRANRARDRALKMVKNNG